jgi:hypothetical protein
MRANREGELVVNLPGAESAPVVDLEGAGRAILPAAGCLAVQVDPPRERQGGVYIPETVAGRLRADCGTVVALGKGLGFGVWGLGERERIGSAEPHPSFRPLVVPEPPLKRGTRDAGAALDMHETPLTPLPPSPRLQGEGDPNDGPLSRGLRPRATLRDPSGVECQGAPGVPSTSGEAEGSGSVASGFRNTGNRLPMAQAGHGAPSTSGEAEGSELGICGPDHGRDAHATFGPLRLGDRVLLRPYHGLWMEPFASEEAPIAPVDDGGYQACGHCVCIRLDPVPKWTNLALPDEWERPIVSTGRVVSRGSEAWPVVGSRVVFSNYHRRTAHLGVDALEEGLVVVEDRQIYATLGPSSYRADMVRFYGAGTDWRKSVLMVWRDGDWRPVAPWVLIERDLSTPGGLALPELVAARMRNRARVVAWGLGTGAVGRDAGERTGTAEPHPSFRPLVVPPSKSDSSPASPLLDPPLKRGTWDAGAALDMHETPLTPLPPSPRLQGEGDPNDGPLSRGLRPRAEVLDPSGVCRKMGKPPCSADLQIGSSRLFEPTMCRQTHGRDADVTFRPHYSTTPSGVEGQGAPAGVPSTSGEAEGSGSVASGFPATGNELPVAQAAAGVPSTSGEAEGSGAEGPLKRGTRAADGLECADQNPRCPSHGPSPCERECPREIQDGDDKASPYSMPAAATEHRPPGGRHPHLCSSRHAGTHTSSKSGSSPASPWLDPPASQGRETPARVTGAIEPSASACRGGGFPVQSLSGVASLRTAEASAAAEGTGNRSYPWHGNAPAHSLTDLLTDSPAPTGPEVILDPDPQGAITFDFGDMSRARQLVHESSIWAILER